MDVHAANKEHHKGPFDMYAERDALKRLTGDDSVEVLIGTSENTAGQYIVRYWKGRIKHATFPRPGTPYDFGPYLIEFYHRDRVAEILRKHKES